MAIGTKPIQLNKEELMKFIPSAISVSAILFLVFILILPQSSKLISFSKELLEKRNAVILAERGSLNFQEVKKTIIELEKKASQLEKGLPQQIETTLLIDTLKDITEESQLKFSSIEPMPQKRYELKGQEDFYLELPIKVKLNCTFFDLITFLEKIENSPRLMKLSDLSISSNPQNAWEHNVEVTISTFASGRK